MDLFPDGIMKRIFGSVGLANRALILIGLVVALTTTCVVTAAYWALSNEFSARARNDIETNLRTLALVYATKYPETKIKLEGDKVVRAEAPSFPGIFPDHTIVDTTAAYAGGNATLFQWDQATKQFVRRTTNVKKENGDRAIGTQLAPDHPGQEPLRAARPIKGRRFCSAASSTRPTSRSSIRRTRRSVCSMSATRARATTR